ncbi:MAG TPA: hypothetical protein VIT88_10955 [Pyrinomonadaceae bacterium]
MKSVNSKKSLLLCVLTSLLLASACQRTDNTNTTVTTNANITPAANTNSSPVSGSTIVTREPEQYRATLVFSAETEGGEKTIGIPSLSAEIARNGADRRVAFKLPDGSDLIYLETGGKHIVVAPGRKQYAELTPEATGVQLQKLMTPGQIASYLDKLKGVEKVGEETFNGRLAEKYRYATTANTSTSAGQVSAEAFVYVDKDTGLPLRSELYTEATGDVKGVKGAKIVAEMRDINTTVDPTLFQVPTGLNKVPPEQVRAQIESVTKAIAAGLQILMSNMNASRPATTTPTASPAVSPTPRTTP